MPMTLTQVYDLAAHAHSGQTDKIGAPYFGHVRAVAAALAPFGPELEMAGLLHDIVEDTDWTPERLLVAGVPPRTVAAVVAVTNQPGEDYQDKIVRITASRDATLVKIADTAHNSRRDRAELLPAEKRERLAAKYAAARRALWAAAAPADVETILRIVNPELLTDAAHI
ncbi:phosphohydrolase [Streptomyces sp. SID11385]|uniref:phosphohydrolase n=1 Tax=Streptomyces sp. SID11385 TaxID=2706031 RepID=UPI0013C6259B|nr:phosphohydrolase [Streptomyces sp. SID11385]NEA39296.1 phosphohydrolase [Streptomyces sp. SID11385]